MPLKSCSDLVLDERSPSCSSQSSATETYTVPLGTSTEIDFKYDDEQVANILDKIPIGKPNGNVTTIIGDNNLVGAKVNIGVDAESTTININHYHPKPDPDAVDDESKNNAPANKPSPTSHPKRGLEILKRHYKFIIVVITSITLVCAIALITLHFTPKKQDEIITSTTTAGTTRAPSPHLIHYIFNKSQWGGRPSTKQIPIEVPISLLIIKHTHTQTCQDVSSCFSAMQQLQNIDVGEHELPDIRYNFMIGGDGNIYVGRGWKVQNEQMNNTIDVAYLGNFNEDVPSDFMVAAGPWLMVKGALQGFVDEATVRIVCHNQTEMTDSPGKNLYKEVVKWKYYSDEIILGTH